MRVVITGASGRMGQALIQYVKDTSGMVLHGLIERVGAPSIGLIYDGVKITDDAALALKGADCVIDFTIPQATVPLCQLAASMGVAHIIGTTGFSEADEAVIAQCALKTTIVKSGNMSLGVNLLAALVEQAAQKLSDEWDIEILEMHHKHKIDAPSGTALLLGEAAAKGRGVALKDKRVSTRDGHTGARLQGDIGFATLRGGMIVGEHEVTFASDSERIILSHKAADRGLFARGALHAALWTKGKPHGLYNMKDVLGL
jgi:4-hydroxy-tetrahydrodipicolinate reductase